jgi:hypothetical protein
MLERWAQTVDIMVRSLTGDADGLLECPGLPQEETLMTMGVSWDLLIREASAHSTLDRFSIRLERKEGMSIFQDWRG